MEPTVQKGLERLISQKALQMSSSFHCKIWAVGFLCGVCATYFFLAALTSFKTLEFGVFYSTPSQNLSSIERTHVTRSVKFQSMSEEVEIKELPQKSKNLSYDEKVLLLYSTWSALLVRSEDGEDHLIGEVGLKRSSVPPAPHLEDCKLNAQTNQQFERREGNKSFPPWSIWKGLLGLQLPLSMPPKRNEQRHFGGTEKFEGAYPPWVVGSDEDNFPLTRRVQQDIWFHQHPLNCSDSKIRFLIADWERLPGFGMGAQLAGMAGLLAIAINEKRVLVTNYFNRADHDECQGSSRSHWSCYFFSETSQKCRDHALELMMSQEAWQNGIITVKKNYTSKEIWSGRIPRIWGDPWNYLQPTTEIEGNLVMHHRKMDRRWWRAQAIRYLMRFQSQYTCRLLNMARHTSFGMQAAQMAVGSLSEEWPQVNLNRSRADIKEFVWSNHKPWIPRPLVSIHVRMGDKASEMKVVGFENYMHLADRIRAHFPNLNNIWLSTEMQEVIDKTRIYPNWNFYYTNITRQSGNLTMASYEASLGRETSTNYPLVNFMMAAEADFYVGALGSTWCFLIDGMRNTGGKVMAGYLSVNKDRFW